MVSYMVRQSYSINDECPELVPRSLHHQKWVPQAISQPIEPSKATKWILGAPRWSIEAPKWIIEAAKWRLEALKWTLNVHKWTIVLC